MMRCRQARITIAKVRAHAGIAGNELADVVAKATVAPTDEVVFTECGSAGRGAAWVRYTHGDSDDEDAQVRDVDTLDRHALHIANERFQKKEWVRMKEKAGPSAGCVLSTKQGVALTNSLTDTGTCHGWGSTEE